MTTILLLLILLLLLGGGGVFVRPDLAMPISQSTIGIIIVIIVVVWLVREQRPNR